MTRKWIFWFALIFGVFVWLPFLAPIFMRAGWEGAGNAVYFIYSFFCHQLPERSYFLFGEKLSYSLPEIEAVWQNNLNPMILRKFAGTPDMGWKVAWSDRMVWMYTSIWFFGLLWWIMRKRIKPLPFWAFLLLLLPMAVDGGTHLISDLAGIGQGFRDSNLWLAILTRNTFPPDFYAGDAWGSFNAFMRLGTGLLFGLGVVWFGFPYLNESLEPRESSVPALAQPAPAAHL